MIRTDPIEPLDSETETHLWDGSLTDLVTEQIEETTTTILCLVPEGEDTLSLTESLRSVVDEEKVEIEAYNGDHAELPYESNVSDLTVHINPKRGCIQRHRPFYEAERVTAPGGTVVFNAPNYLAHSKYIDHEVIYAMDWENHETINVAAVGTVTQKGDLNNFNNQPDESNEKSLAKRRVEQSNPVPETNSTKADTSQSELLSY